MLRPPFTQAQLITLSTALVFGFALHWLGAPLPFLFGSLVACLLLAVSGQPLQGTPLLSTVSRTILGVAIGASITWSLLEQFASLAPTLLLVPLYIVVIAFIGLHYFHRLMGYDKITAYYAAMPGALQDMVVFGEESGGNTRALSLIHATRLLLMVSLAPLILVLIFDASLDNPLGPPATELPFYHLPLILLIGISGWQIARRLKIFGASVTGPLLLSIPLSLSGVLTDRPSQEVIMVSQFFIGVGVGVYYRGITSAEIRRDVLAASGFVLLLLLIAAVFTFIAVAISSISSSELFLSFWPAGQAEIAVLGLAAGANIGIVVAHHLVRVVLIIMGAPVFARLMSKANKE